MKLAQENYYGLLHDKINERFSGDLTYVGDMCLEKSKVAVAVYHAKTPDTSKGHKEYMLLQVYTKSGGVVAGRSKEEIEKESIHSAVHCLICDTVMYSLNRHNFTQCKCENRAFADGGKDYFRCGYKERANTKFGTYNVLTKEFIENKLVTEV